MEVLERVSLEYFELGILQLTTVLALLKFLARLTQFHIDLVSFDQITHNSVTLLLRNVYLLAQQLVFFLVVRDLLLKLFDLSVLLWTETGGHPVVPMFVFRTEITVAFFTSFLREVSLATVPLLLKIFSQELDTLVRCHF